MPDEPQSIEAIEEAIYQALIVEVPDLLPVVARSLARTTAERLRERRAANEKLVTAEQIRFLNNPRKFPDTPTHQNHENDQQP
jgi:hypothetical protein